MTILLTVEEAAKELCIGRTRMYALIKSDVASVKIGRSRRVPYAEVEAYAKKLIAPQSVEPGEAA